MQPARRVSCTEKNRLNLTKEKIITAAERARPWIVTFSINSEAVKPVTADTIGRNLLYCGAPSSKIFLTIIR